MYFIGIDIGGMSIKSGIVDESGKIIKSSIIKTEKIADTEQIKLIAKDVLKLIDESGIDKKEIKGIGCGCPSPCGENGIMSYAANLKWRNTPLQKLLEELTGLPTKIANDADVAALAEAKFGSAKKYDTIVMLTIGTGVGGGVVINKKLYTGPNGYANELGHAVIRYNGIKCGCGKKGCLEQYASASALIRQTKEAMLKDKNSLMWQFVDNDIEKVNGITSFACAKQGDKTANRVVNKFCDYIATGIVNYCAIFRPNAIILGGAISKEGEYLTKKLRRIAKKYEYGYPNTMKVDIITAELKNDAGIIGAASLIM